LYPLLIADEFVGEQRVAMSSDGIHQAEKTARDEGALSNGRGDRCHAIEQSSSATGMRARPAC
jgi:hypothetical protein